MSEVNLSIMIDDIIVNEGRREINTASVKKLAQSIEQVGLRHPITVKRKGEQYLLIAGRHRLEACKKLGREHISASIVTMNNDEARLWEIAENLHRAELSKLERDDNIAEWIKITERVHSSRIGPNESKRADGRGHPPEGGINAAARELGVDRSDAHRAVKVSSLSDEAKDAARATGLDDNRSALLEAASKPTVAEQVASIHNRHTAKVVKIADDPLNDMESHERQVAGLMAAWNKAGAVAREEFLCRIDQSIMGKKWA